MENFNKKKVAIVGWGINGLDAVKYLLKLGAEITILDQKETKELDFSGFENSKVKFVLGSNYLKNGLNNFDYIFRSPGVYRFLPEIIKAEKNNVVVTSTLQLFFDLCPARIIGVTGTKGKGTTSTLIYEILKEDCKDVYLAGNIGYPMLELLPQLTRKSWVVLELSSFQLIDMKKSPYIAVVLNITEDHLDWHKDKRQYLDSKRNIVRYQKISDIAIINSDYEVSRSFEKDTQSSNIYYFSKVKKVKGCYVENGTIKLYLDKKAELVGRTDRLLLRGVHNRENIIAAILAGKKAGTSLRSIKSAVYTFKGLEHRLELVRTYNGVTFYDDSFSTNPQTTEAAINSFEEPITIILGGFDKQLNYDEMSKVFSKRSNIVNVVLVGDIAKKMEKSLLKFKFSGNIINMDKTVMKDVVEKCFKVTPKGGVVLLSPASSSFDMFKDYKDRGNQFKKAVLDLTSV